MSIVNRDCEEYHSKPRLSLSESGVTLVLTNSNAHDIRQIRIDGCIFPRHDTQTKRCDHRIDDRWPATIQPRIRAVRRDFRDAKGFAASAPVKKAQMLAALCDARRHSLEEDQYTR